MCEVLPTRHLYPAAASHSLTLWPWGPWLWQISPIKPFMESVAFSFLFICGSFFMESLKFSPSSAMWVGQKYKELKLYLNFSFLMFPSLNVGFTCQVYLIIKVIFLRHGWLPPAEACSHHGAVAQQLELEECACSDCASERGLPACSSPGGM